MKIDSYSFGQIIINGKEYTSDVIIYKDHINSSWRRQEGHDLAVEDLFEVFTAKPEILIIGTGAAGVMRVSPQIIKAIEAKGIKVIVKKTGEAYKMYNEESKKGNVIAALHLTC